jgi:hypothetical protein
LKNAYQVATKDARGCFGKYLFSFAMAYFFFDAQTAGLKSKLRVQDLAPLITEGGQFCMPVDPTLPLAVDNVRVIINAGHRKALLQLWRSTKNTTLYCALFSQLVG